MSSPSAIQPYRSDRSDKDKHFFASVVSDKEQLPLYRRMVIWMLKEDVITTLHLRVRVVASARVKARARQLSDKYVTSAKSDSRGSGREWAERAKTRLSDKEGRKSSKSLKNHRGRRSFRGSALQLDDNESGVSASMPSIAFADQEKRRRRFSSNSASRDRENLVIREEKHDSEPELGPAPAIRMGPVEWEGNDDDNGKHFIDENSLKDSIIWNPARPTPIEEKWLNVMSEGKDPDLAKRFEQYVCTLCTISRIKSFFTS